MPPVAWLPEVASAAASFTATTMRRSLTPRGHWSSMPFPNWGRQDLTFSIGL